MHNSLLSVAWCVALLMLPDQLDDLIASGPDYSPSRDRAGADQIRPCCCTQVVCNRKFIAQQEAQHEDKLFSDNLVHTSVQCVATVMMLAGVVFFGILIGSLGEIVQHASTRARQAQMFRRKFEDVEAWMRMRRLPKHTQKKIR